MAFLSPRKLLPCVVAAAFLAGGSAAADDSLEYAVKAAYLVKFIPFIDWPEAVLSSPAQPVTICLVGEDPFGARLSAMAAEKSGERSVAVRHLASLETATECQMLFLGKSATQDQFEAVKGKPIVTVTDSGAVQPGIISFVIADNHVRFDIDDAGANASGIKISSKLLELAHAVHRRAPS